MTQLPLSLPAGCLLRRGKADDMSSMRKLIFRARLDPTQLRWQQFWVIEWNGNIVACGQLRNFADAQELGSIVVASEWQGRGLGSYLTKHLIGEATQPLDLECLGKRLADFYGNFGFVSISWQDLPESLKLKFGISQLGRIVLRIPVAIMQYGGKQSTS